MTNEQFDALVRRLDRDAERAPGRYRLKVLLLAMMGTAYMGVMLVLLLGALGILVAFISVLKFLGAKLIFLVAILLWAVVKALWVVVPPPEGVRLGPEQAPELFAIVEGLRRDLGAPHFHQVLVTDDLNASVAQAPRLGVFGWPRNYLQVGLPLMKTLTAEQFKAVLAHEFGHLANGHGRWSNWIYRQRLRWARLTQTLDTRQGFGTFLFKPFFHWFVPYFNAYSFPLARQNEYQADRTAVRLTSPNALAQALTNLDVVSNFLAERYWPSIHRQAEDHPAPAFGPYGAMGPGLAADLDEVAARSWMEQSLARDTGMADTHPALADRLKGIGAAAELVLPAPGQAADRLLGPALGPITERFDDSWKDAIRRSWEDRHRDVQQDRARLTELNECVRNGTQLSVSQACERARLTGSVGKNPDEALAQFRALHDEAPEDASVCLHLGARLLARDDAAGVELVERAAALDKEALASACEILRDYFLRKDRKEEARAWHETLVARLQDIELETLERRRVLLDDHFDLHGLEDEELSRLCASLKKVAGLRRVYLLRKRVLRVANVPCYILGFSVTGPFQLHRKDAAERAMRQIQQEVEFPGQTIIISVDGENYRFGRKFRFIRGARIA